jgi:UDP-N-acetyl-D-galactosamine dehydrogenase
VDIINELKDYGVTVLTHDPLAIPEEAREHCGIDLVSLKEMRDMDAVILAVAHRDYLKLGLEKLVSLCRKDRPILLDIKSVFEPVRAQSLGIRYWRL